MTPAQYRNARLAMGATQSELADKLGIPRETISRREHGRQRITIEAVIAITMLEAWGRRRIRKYLNPNHSKP